MISYKPPICTNLYTYITKYQQSFNRPCHAKPKPINKKNALISAKFDSGLTLPKTPWSTDHSVYYQRHQSRQSHVRAPEKTDHHDDNMQITHIGIIMITLTRTPMTRINMCSKHTEIHIIYVKVVPMTLVSNYPKIWRNTTWWQNCALSNTLMKIQITLLFKALRRGPVCQFHPLEQEPPWPESICALNIRKFILFTWKLYLWRTSGVRDFKYTTRLVAVWRKFNWTTASAPNKNVKERILIKRQFKIDRDPHPEWSLASLTALHWTSHAATNTTARAITEPHIFARRSEKWRKIARLKHK